MNIVHLFLVTDSLVEKKFIANSSHKLYFIFAKFRSMDYTGFFACIFKMILPKASWKWNKNDYDWNAQQWLLTPKQTIGNYLCSSLYSSLLIKKMVSQLH